MLQTADGTTITVNTNNFGGYGTAFVEVRGKVSNGGQALEQSDEAVEFGNGFSAFHLNPVAVFVVMLP